MQSKVLEELQVTNLGVIAEARIIFDAGMHAVTGETGAGKTLIVEALNLVTGSRADSDVVGPVSDEAIVEASFSDAEPSEWVEPGDSLVLTRVISRSGRGRGYINGRLASLAQLRQASDGLISINGQNSALGLLSQSGQLDAIDRYGGTALAKRKIEFAEAYARLRATRDLLDRLGGDPQQVARDMDLLEYQLDEIESAKPTPGEDSALLDEARRLSSIAVLRESAVTARAAAESAAECLSAPYARQGGDQEADAEFESLVGRGASIAVELSELASDIRRFAEGLEEDPVRLAWVNERLEVLATLKRKYGPSLDEVDAFWRDTRERLDEIAGLDEVRQTAERDLNAAIEESTALATELSDARKSASVGLASDVQRHLGDLELGGARFNVEIDSGSVTDGSELGPSGLDRAKFTFSANDGIEPRPVSKIASGGELSRLMLAIELAMSDGKRSTALVFDEIDAGIGGVTASSVAEKLSALADRMQVICVTHLPQIASRAECHYLVKKASGSAVVAELGEAERRDEISRMLAGAPDSEHALMHASELIESAVTSRDARRASIQSRG